MSCPIRRADAFLARNGMEPDRIDPASVTRSFLSEMETGLAGRPSSVYMLPTYLPCGGPPPQGRPAAVLDLGGSHLRAGLVTFTQSGPAVSRLQSGPAPGTDGPVSWEAFTARLAALLLPLLEETDRVGFCFSHPAEITPDRDGRILSLSKQVRVEGAAGKLLCAELSRALGARGVHGTQLALLNDAAAALLGAAALTPPGRYDAVMSLICGTGINTCCAVPCARQARLAAAALEGSMPVNLESGAFSLVPQGVFDTALDANTRDPGAFLLEKMAGGGYLGELMRLTLAGAARDGLLPPAFSELISLSAREADRFSRDPAGENALARLCVTSDDRAVVSTIIGRLTDRAARLVCCNLSAMLLLTGAGTLAHRPALFAAEGALFLQNSLFRPRLERHMAQFASGALGRHWRFSSVDRVNLFGAAAAALSPP